MDALVDKLKVKAMGCFETHMTADAQRECYARLMDAAELAAPYDAEIVRLQAENERLQTIVEVCTAGEPCVETLELIRRLRARVAELENFVQCLKMASGVNLPDEEMKQGLIDLSFTVRRAQARVAELEYEAKRLSDELARAESMQDKDGWKV